MTIENGDKAVVKELSRIVITEEMGKCRIGADNKNNITNITREVEEVKEEFKSFTGRVYEKLDKVAEKHNGQWLSVAGATILQLVAIIVAGVLLYMRG